MIPRQSSSNYRALCNNHKEEHRGNNQRKIYKALFVLDARIISTSIKKLMRLVKFAMQDFEHFVQINLSL